VHDIMANPAKHVRCPWSVVHCPLQKPADNGPTTMEKPMLDIRPEVAASLRDRRPGVALESTLIAHGLPWPVNAETARAAEEPVRAEGGPPATIPGLGGNPPVGSPDAELPALPPRRAVLKASRRDLAAAIAQGRTAATTVSATMALAHRAGIRLFATGGIGGVHPGAAPAGGVSADLLALAPTPVRVASAAAHRTLDPPPT